jgi:hypothetical protein
MTPFVLKLRSTRCPCPGTAAAWENRLLRNLLGPMQIIRDGNAQQLGGLDPLGFREGLQFPHMTCMQENSRLFEHIGLLLIEGIVLFRKTSIIIGDSHVPYFGAIPCLRYFLGTFC